jgi:dipeptidyl aminopeptidase/acylaminoacyl peptidase
VQISPDGHYLSMLALRSDRRVALVADLTGHDPARMVLSSDLNQATDLSWCHFANDTRLVCGIREMTTSPNGIVYISTRLIAVDADGKNSLVLMQDQSTNPGMSQGQLQDNVVDWAPGKPNTILVASPEIQVDAKMRALMRSGGGSLGAQYSEFPAVYEVDIVTGTMTLRLHAQQPIRHILTDGHGEARFGWGYQDRSTQIEYYVRPNASQGWRLLQKSDFSSARLDPAAICPDNPDCAYAFGQIEGRNALWRMDLTGVTPPKIGFSHPAVDVQSAVLDNNQRLIGVTYETDRPFFYATDPKIEAILDAVKPVLPDAYISVVSMTRDDRWYVFRTTSDIDPGSYYLYDSQKGALRRIATGFPDLDIKSQGRMQSISYPAQDGTSIPGYLTVPPGKRAESLPLVVLPHDGPETRDHWEFSFLRSFLVSRGYAVLQMNFRGSSGYGNNWRAAASQDWSGLPLSDVTDGVRWAINQGIADPKRVCILGWGFGGYVALLSAERYGDLYRCAASIAGVSDLSLLEEEQHIFASSAMSERRIGTNRSKLEQDSPSAHAGAVAMPVLMIHGDKDAEINVGQSQAMDTALKIAGKAHEFIMIRGADHQMTRVSDRLAVLNALDQFLGQHLGPGVN